MTFKGFSSEQGCMTFHFKRHRGVGGARVPRVLATLIVASMVQSSIEEIGEIMLHHPSGLLAREPVLMHRGCFKGSAISANTSTAFFSDAELSSIPMRANGRRVRERLSDVTLLLEPALCGVGGSTKGQSSMVVDAGLGLVEAEDPSGVPFGSAGATKPSSDGWKGIHDNDVDESVSWEWNLKNMLNEQNGELRPSDPAETKPSIVGWRKRDSISYVRYRIYAVRMTYLSNGLHACRLKWFDIYAGGLTSNGGYGAWGL